MRLALTLLLAAAAGQAQTIFQITATQGDGSQCTGTRYAGQNVNFNLACVNPVRGLPSETHRIYNAGSLQPRQTGTQTVAFGDILCMFGVNPTATPATFPNLGTVPATSLGYACAVNIRTSGTVTGNMQGAAGNVIWPVPSGMARFVRILKMVFLIGAR